MLLDIRNLQLEFGTGRDAVRAVDGVSFTIAEGETLCLVAKAAAAKAFPPCPSRASCPRRPRATSAAKFCSMAATC